MPTLVSPADAPWSLRARRALDEAGLAERTGPEGPLLSQPSPRWRLGRWLHPVTVPVPCRETGPPLTDSVDVACRARPQGAAHPPPDPAAVLGWSERDHRALAADPRRPPRPE